MDAILAAGRFQNAGQDFQQRGLAATGWTDQADELAVGHGEVDRRQRVDHAAARGAVGFCQVADGDRRLAGRKPRRFSRTAAAAALFVVIVTAAVFAASATPRCRRRCPAPQVTDPARNLSSSKALILAISSSV